MENTPTTENDAGHELRVLDQTGDSAIKWDKSSPAEVEAARAMFDALKAKDYTCYLASANGDKTSKRLDAFDPDAERLVMVPPLKGGYPVDEPTYE